MVQSKQAQTQYRLRKGASARKRSLGYNGNNYNANTANYNSNNNQYSSYYAATANQEDDSYMLDNGQNDDATQASWQYGNTQGNGNKDNVHNYVWARDDDDDYYSNMDDTTYNYWSSNKNLKASANYGDDDKYTVGGNYVQHDDRTYNNAGFGGDNGGEGSRGYMTYGDDDGTDEDEDANDRSGNEEGVGLGLLTEGQRVALAVTLSVVMILLLTFLLFGPLIMSSLYHCCCCCCGRRKTKNKDLAASLADLGDW